MPTYKSFTEAFKDLKLNLNKVADAVKKEIQSTLRENRAMGVDLKDETKRKKVRNKDIKLVENEGLIDFVKTQVQSNEAKIFYDSMPHKSVSNKSAPLTMASLAEIHNEGKGVCPMRMFLYDKSRKEWLEQYKKRVKEEIKRQWQSKGII